MISYLNTQPQTDASQYVKSESGSTRPIKDLTEIIADGISGATYVMELTGVLALFNAANDITGGYIKMEKKFGFCPILVGSDGRCIPLYEFVEALDESVDYDEIKKLLPTLSFSQIAGAISFLRKIAQFNSKGVDIDKRLDEEFEQDPGFLRELGAAFSDQEVARVLNFD